MHISRYSIKWLCGIGLLTTVICTPVAFPAVPGAAGVSPAAASVAQNLAWTRDDAAHLLRRAGFGGTPEQVDRLYAMGRDGAVEYLITGQAPAGAAPVFAPVALVNFQMDVPEVPVKGQKGKAAGAATQPVAGAATPATGPATQPNAGIAAAKAKNAMRRQEIQELREWSLERMVRTDRPLDEKMTLFWHNLFTTGVKEVKVPYWIYKQDLLFREQATGNYKALTHAVVHDPAMLKYLNNDENVKGKPNENLARELMELFTMGEGNGYSEADIAQVARALTGLAAGPQGARMRDNMHDDGTKTIFGQSGNYGPDEVVELIFARPQPARRLARRLWEYFAYPNPSDADLAPVVQAIVSSGYDVKPALRAMFTSPAFYGDRAKFALIKSPAELSVETLRTLDVPVAEGSARVLENRVKAMDQELFQPPNVRGWVGGDNWITASTLYTRYNTACAMINGTLRGGGNGKGMKVAAVVAAEPAKPAAGKAARVQQPDELGIPTAGPNAVAPAKLFPTLAEGTSGATPAQLVDAAIARFLQRPLNPEKRNVLIEMLGPSPLKLGQPDADDRARQMLALLVSTPEYQVH